MCCRKVYCFLLLASSICCYQVTAYMNDRNFECGLYGFTCESQSKLRLCEGLRLNGPAFLCPPGTICNQDSNHVCEDIINYVEPLIRSIRCRRYERIADPNVPGCKGYVLCIPNKDKFQGIKFKCTGNTVFNGYTRTCSSPSSYKCPMGNVTQSELDIFGGGNSRMGNSEQNPNSPTVTSADKTRPIECMNYKLTVTQDNSPVKTAYFCPRRPARTGVATKCTVFSNQFCLILDRVDEDQFLQNFGAASRRPRINGL